MKTNLSVALIQTELVWEDISKNLNALTMQINQVKPETDLIILPEMFSTGFTMNAAGVAEEMDGSAMQWLKEQAQKHQVAITGSLVIKENQQYFNRLIWMNPDGQFFQYDKRHLFTYAKEHLTYTGGQAHTLISFKGWKILPLVCYDLRFPVWSRNTLNYELLIYVANWPQKRNLAWNQLLRARAIENLSYTIGVNRVGLQPDGLSYSGDSQLVQFDGQILQYAANQPAILQVTLNYEAQQAFRQRFNFLADQDHFIFLN